MTITLSRCTTADVQALRSISYETFDETFAPYNTPDNMSAYMDQAYDVNKLEEELLHPHSQFYFVIKDGQHAGYMKLNTDDAQSEPMGDEALEIERIYVRSTFQKQGLGRYLLDQALNIAAEHRKSEIWLGVWENNDNALAFYHRLGFVQIGEHSFYMGDDRQTDLIMMRKL